MLTPQPRPNDKIFSSLDPPGTSLKPRRQYWEVMKLTDAWISVSEKWSPAWWVSQKLVEDNKVHFWELDRGSRPMQTLYAFGDMCGVWGWDTTATFKGKGENDLWVQPKWEESASMTSVALERRGRAFCRFLRGHKARGPRVEAGWRKEGAVVLGLWGHFSQTSGGRRPVSRTSLPEHFPIVQGLGTNRFQEIDHMGQRNR